MSDVIISVEGLGKKYVLSHQGGERGGYARFSERLEDWVKNRSVLGSGCSEEMADRRSEMGGLKVTHLPSPISHLRPRRKNSGR